MTGEDHDTDALIAALTSPPLPSEQVGEDAAVTAMLDALPGASMAPAAGRPRRGIAIAAVTIASLGVGGLVAAGPGAFFSPAADRTPAADPSTTEVDPAAPPTRADAVPDARPTDPSSTSTSSTLAIAAEQTPADAGRAAAPEGSIDCEEPPGDATHGDMVSEVARSTVPDQRVRDVARSDCGKPDAADGESPSDTAPARAGDTPGVTAPGRTGDAPADDTPASTAPGQAGTTPAVTAPAVTAPAVTAPAVTAPGRSGTAPDDAPPERNGSTGVARSSGDQRP